MAKTPKPETETPEAELARARMRASSIVGEIRAAWREPERLQALFIEAIGLPERIAYFTGALEVQRQLDALAEAEMLDKKSADLEARAREAEGKVSQIRDSIDREVEMGRVNILRSEATKTRKLAEARRRNCEWMAKSDTARTIRDVEERKVFLLRRQKVQAEPSYIAARDPDHVENLLVQLKAADLEIQRLAEKAERRGTAPVVIDEKTWGPQARNIADNAGKLVRMKLFGQLWGEVGLDRVEALGE